MGHSCGPEARLLELGRRAPFSGAEPCAAGSVTSYNRDDACVVPWPRLARAALACYPGCGSASSPPVANGRVRIPRAGRPSFREDEMSSRPSRRWRADMVAALAAGALAAGCAGSKHGLQHPTTNDLDPAYAQMKVKTLATLPFASDISDSDDPDKIAASMAESKFYPALAQARRFN